MRNKLVDTLVSEVIKYNNEEFLKIDDVIRDINDRIKKCAKRGYTSFVINFTTNELCDMEHSLRTYNLLAANDVIQDTYVHHIADYYRHEELDISYSMSSMVISWDDALCRN